jgi:hypothetical protein
VRRSRTGRLLLALAAMVLFVIVVVVVVGEVWVRPTVEDQIAKGVAREFDLSVEPDVQVKGFPLVLRALQERLDGVDVSVEDQVFEGLRVRAVDLHIDEVRFTSSELLRGSGTVVISGGDGQADILDDDLTEYLVGTGLAVDVRFEGGTVRVTGPVTVAGITANASVVGTLALDGDVLRFTPTTVDVGSIAGALDVAAVEAVVRQQFRFTAPVPQLQGVTLTEVSIGDGNASVDAVFDSLAVDY